MSSYSHTWLIESYTPTTTGDLSSLPFHFIPGRTEQWKMWIGSEKKLCLQLIAGGELTKVSGKFQVDVGFDKRYTPVTWIGTILEDKTQGWFVSHHLYDRQELLKHVDSKGTLPIILTVREAVFEFRTDVFAERMRAVLKTKTSSADTLVKLEKGHEMQVHSQFLRVFSPVFELAFTVDMKEKQQKELDLTAYSETAVRALLDFVYTGSTSAMSTMEKWEPVAELFKLSEMYEADFLSRAIVPKLLALTTATNMVETVQLLHQHNRHQDVSCKRKLYELLSDDLGYNHMIEGLASLGSSLKKSKN